MSDSDFVVYEAPSDVEEEDETEEEVEEVAAEELDLPVEPEDKSDEMATIIARKWRGHLSELEVDEELITQTRPLITVTVHRLRKFFGQECNFEDSDRESNTHLFASFESQDPSLRKFIHRMEIDRGTQVKGPSVDCTTQTCMSFKRNKMLQFSTQSISDENVDIIMKSRNMAQFFKTAMPKLEKVMQQNEMLDILFNDYKEGMKSKFDGHETEFSTDPTIVPHPDDVQKDKKKDEDTPGTIAWMRLHAAEQKTIIKRDGMELAEEIEQEDRLNNEYLLYLKFQAEVLERLAKDEPENPTAKLDLADEFETLVREAQMQQAEEDAEEEALLDEEEEEEDEARRLLLEATMAAETPEEVSAAATAGGGEESATTDAEEEHQEEASIPKKKSIDKKI